MDKIYTGDKLHLKINGVDEGFYLFGTPEVNNLNCMSFNSPLGKALLGKSLHDKISIKVGSEIIICEVLEVIKKPKE